MNVQIHSAALRDPKTFFVAVEALEAIGEEAIPILANALNDESLYPNLSTDPGEYDNKRRAIVKALEELGALSKSAIPDLIRAFQDERMDTYTGMRSAAAYALVKIAPSDETVITALVNALHSSMAVHAAFALGKAGTHAKPALPALKDALLSSMGGARDMIERAHSRELMAAIQAAIKEIQASV